MILETLVSPPNPLLTICMCRLESRSPMSGPLIDQLTAQASRSGVVEFLTCTDGGEAKSGAKRHALSVTARGAYLAFVDDDDIISDDYIDLLLAGCEQGVDVVTFKALYFHASHKVRRTQIFGLKHEDGVILGRKAGQTIQTMMPNHLCAWRRELARKVAFPPNLGYNDDCLWYRPLLATGWPRTEFHIDKVLYFYNFNPQITANQQAPSCRYTYRWARGGIECFMRDNQVYIATEGKAVIEGVNPVPCRDHNNQIVFLDREVSRCYYVWRAQ